MSHPNGRPVLSVATGVGVAAIVVLLLYLAAATRLQQIHNAPLLPEIKSLAEQIDSCVDQTAEDGDPVGDCYARGQQQQADLIGVPHGPINTVTVLATYCQITKGADTIPEILDCVDSQLAHLKGQPDG